MKEIGKINIKERNSIFKTNGNVYEGKFYKWRLNGKGIFYYKNWDRIMGNYLDGKPIGIHAKREQFGYVTSKYYN